MIHVHRSAVTAKIVKPLCGLVLKSPRDELVIGNGRISFLHATSIPIPKSPPYLAEPDIAVGQIQHPPEPLKIAPHGSPIGEVERIPS